MVIFKKIVTFCTIIVMQDGHARGHALKRPDRSKQCHCLQFAICTISLLKTDL